MPWSAYPFETRDYGKSPFCIGLVAGKKSDIRGVDRGGCHTDKHFARSRPRDGDTSKLQLAVLFF
jgi:hypothetical protein